MPYSSTSELPDPVRSKYSDKCQRAFMHAFNSVYEQTHDDGRSSAAGHSAAQDCEGKKAMAIDLVKDADFLELTTEEIEFKIFTRDHDGQGMALKAWEEGEGQDGDWLIAGIASSTIRDHHGDTMLPSALMDMEKAANANLTIFLNHKYQVPEDVAGSVRKATLTTRASDAEGNPIYDLDFKLAVNKTNPRAVEAFKAIKGGTKLGLSIGANIPPGGAVKNKKDGTFTIMHVDLLETSIVSIPANPRSWIDYAVKALKSGKTATVGEDGPEVVTQIRTSEGTGVEMIGIEAPADGTMVTLDTTEAADDPAITSDTTPSQEAPESDPENDGGATEEVIATATDVLERAADPAVKVGLTEALLEAHNALAAVTDSLIDERRNRIELEGTVDRLTKERDQARATSQDIVHETANLIDQLGKLPVGQKASFKRIQEDFEDLEKVYPAEFIRQLRSIGK